MSGVPISRAKPQPKPAPPINQTRTRIGQGKTLCQGASTAIPVWNYVHSSLIWRFNSPEPSQFVGTPLARNSGLVGERIDCLWDKLVGPASRKTLVFQRLMQGQMVEGGKCSDSRGQLYTAVSWVE